MAINASRLAAETLRVLPRTQMSRALGRLAALRGPQSVVDAAIAAFVRAYDVDLTEAEVPAAGFRSFDEFFTRRLKSGARAVESDPRALVSPADGRVEDLGPIDPQAVLTVKGQPYTAAELIGDDDAAARYAGGQYFIVYLSPRDYHRVHAPVSGPVTSARYVPGTLFPVNRIGTDHIPQVFARNERVAIVQRSELHGEVTTIMVGAIGVGRISLSFDDLQTNRGHRPGVRTYAPGEVILGQGDELGVFHLGSTAIVMSPAGCALTSQVDRGAAIRMGDILARGGLA